MAKFEEAFKLVLKFEFSSPSNALHKNSTENGWTFMGVYQTANPSLSLWNMVDAVVKSCGGDVKKASVMLYNDSSAVDAVKSVYKTNYWDRMRLDLVTSQHKANEMFVFGVNAGTKAAIKLAQQLVGVVDDGIIGKNTLLAINAFDEAEFDTKFDLKETQYYEGIVARDKSKSIFMNGWKTRAKAV